MRKIQTLFIALLISVSAFAVNDVTIVASSGMPTTTIAYNSNNYTAIDLSQLTAGDLVCFDISFADFDFNLAGFEFELDYPPYLTSMSTSDGDWQTGTGAVFRAGSFITGSTQFLPANETGDRTAGTVANGRGVVRVGMLWTNPNDRPTGSAGTLNTGGVIGSVCFVYNPNSAANCSSLLESVRVVLGTSAGANNDIFANDSAEREAVVTSTPRDAHNRAGVAAYIGNASSLLRGDASKNGVRSASDALECLKCTLLGKSRCTWSADDANQYANVFDYDCSGAVGAADALGLLKLTLNVGNRAAGKNASYYSISSEKGSFVATSDLVASMASVTYSFEGVELLEPTISDADKKDGWFLVHESTDRALQYILANVRQDMVKVPNVTINYKNAASNARIAILSTEHQLFDLSPVQYAPLIEDHSARDGSGLEAQIK
jgi:hypothetical protein